MLCVIVLVTEHILPDFLELAMFLEVPVTEVIVLDVSKRCSNKNMTVF